MRENDKTFFLSFHIRANGNRHLHVRPPEILIILRLAFPICRSAILPFCHFIVSFAAHSLEQRNQRKNFHKLFDLFAFS